MLRIEIFRRAKKFMAQFDQQPGLSKLEKAIENRGWTIVYYDENGNDVNHVLKKFRCTGVALRADAFVYRNGPAKFIALYDDHSNKSKKRRLFHEWGHVCLQHDFGRLTRRQEADADCFAEYCMNWTKTCQAILLPLAAGIGFLACATGLLLLQATQPQPSIQVVISQLPPAPLRCWKGHAQPPLSMWCLLAAAITWWIALAWLTSPGLWLPPSGMPFNLAMCPAPFAAVLPRLSLLSARSKKAGIS